MPDNYDSNEYILLCQRLEDYIGVVENNIDEPDLFGYEIKAHRNSVGSYITLFTKSPDFPKGANSILKDRYGVPYDDIPELKKLHTSMLPTGATHSTTAFPSD